MVKLLCAVVGEAESLFSVDIDADQSVVADLKKVIKTEQQYGFPASKLKLYFAKEDDCTWLASTTESARKLNEGETTTLIQELLQPKNLLQAASSLGKVLMHMPPPSTEQVHVLVVLPTREVDTTLVSSTSATGLSVEAMGQLVEERVNKALRERDEKMSVYSFSELNSATEQRMLKKMRMTQDMPTDMIEPVDTSIPGFGWDAKLAENEESQRAAYMAYLEQHLKPLMEQGGLMLDDIAGDRSVLSIVDPRLPFQINGTADVLLFRGSKKNPLLKLAGVCMVIELKKKVEAHHIPQAVGQLMSCSIKAPNNCYPISLLTDLNDHWHFSWFSDKRVITQVTLQYPKNAIKFIRKALLAPESPASSRDLQDFPRQTIKICRIDDFLPLPMDGRAEEMMEQYELMADVVEPEFLMARRLEYAQNMVQSMPMYSHMYT